MSGDDSKADEPQMRVVDRRWWARGEGPDSDETTDLRKPTYVEDLERRLADTTTQMQAFAAGRQRLQEDFDQVRVRMKREADREIERGRRAVLVELLDVLDNLDRATIAARSAEPGDAPPAALERIEQLIKGVEMVRDQFLAKLAGLGVTRVPALGHPFDTSAHEAVSMAPVEDDARDGLVVDVLKEGYAIGDELLRPASVVVGRKA